MGVLFKNENLSDDMIDILKTFQSYIPFEVVDGEKKFLNQLCVGDQLSVERAVNCVHSVSNGYTPEDRLEGFTMQLGDWHTGVKIFGVMVIAEYPLLSLSMKAINNILPVFNALFNRHHFWFSVHDKQF